MSLYPYPTDFPADDLPIVIAALRGQIPEPSKALHAAWATAGYAAGKIAPDTAQATPVKGPARPVKAMTNEEAASALEQLGKAHASGGAPQAFPTIDWKAFLAVLAKLILQFLPLIP